MSEPVTYQEVNELLSSQEKDMQEFIILQIDNLKEANLAHKQALDARLDRGAKDISELKHDMYGNGKEGLKMIVDRLNQDKKNDEDDSNKIDKWFYVFGAAVLALIGNLIVVILK